MLLFIVKLWLVANVVVSAEGKNCSLKDLKRWDCRLKVSSVVVHVTKDKILLSDGTWRGVDDLPMQKIQEWDAVRLEKLGNRLFLVLSFWSESEGETKMQSRRWIISEVKSEGSVVKTTMKVAQVVQRRTPADEGKFLLDKSEKTELKRSGGKIVWRAGRETGVIE